MVRSEIVVKMEFTGSRVIPIDIPNDVKLIVAYKEKIKHFPEDLKYNPSTEITVAVVDGNFCVIDSGGCKLIVVDEGKEVEF